jgi:tripartite-type tricarboxylate transporter receptor subunit TctC
MMSCTALAFARRAFIAVLATGAIALSATAVAQVGDKAVRMVLPNATGSGVDTITRTAQPALAKALGRSVVVENQPGAGGIVGLQTLTRAAPDGMTLSVVSNNVVIFPSVRKTLFERLPTSRRSRSSASLRSFWWSIPRSQPPTPRS